MADTLTTQSATLATIPAATVIATDDAGAGGQVQIVKLALSTDGSATPITADANGLEVQGAGVAGTPAGGVATVQGVAGGTTLPVTEASAAAIAASVAVMDDWDNTASDGASVSGDVAHDAADAGEPVKVGAVAIAHGTNPTAVAAADRTNLYANRAGVPFVIGGHPNIVSLELAFTAAQTDVAIVTIGASLKIAVTQAQAVMDEANTVAVGFRLGFGTANTPTTTGVVLTHPGLVPGTGVSRGDGGGILGVGADGEDLRFTAEVPTGGSGRVLVSYYTIES